MHDEHSSYLTFVSKYSIFHCIFEFFSNLLNSHHLFLRLLTLPHNFDTFLLLFLHLLHCTPSSWKHIVFIVSPLHSLMLLTTKCHDKLLVHYLMTPFLSYKMYTMKHYCTAMDLNNYANWLFLAPKDSSNSSLKRDGMVLVHTQVHATPKTYSNNVPGGQH